MRKQHGLSLVELLISITLSSVILLGVMAVTDISLSAGRYSAQRLTLDAELDQAITRIRDSVARTNTLRLPAADNPATLVNESLRDVLAVTLDPQLDRDLDGWADANNDHDYEDLDGDTTRDDGEPQRIDEDTGEDMNADGAAGIAGIDDDADGSVDEGNIEDDDEDGQKDEDYSGKDNDNDLQTGEDVGKAAIEGGNDDDDGDGSEDEDWQDIVVFYLDGNGNLRQHLPGLSSGSGINASSDPILLSNVTQFSVKREYTRGGRRPWISLNLTVSQNDGTPVSRTLQVVAGSDL